MRHQRAMTVRLSVTRNGENYAMMRPECASPGQELRREIAATLRALSDERKPV